MLVLVLCVCAACYAIAVMVLEAHELKMDPYLDDLSKICGERE